MGIGLAATVIPTITSDDLEMLSDYWDGPTGGPDEDNFMEVRYQDMVDDGEEEQYWSDLERCRLLYKVLKGKIHFAEFFDHREFDILEDYIETGKKGYPFVYNAYPGGDGIFVVWSKINLPAAESVNV